MKVGQITVCVVQGCPGCGQLHKMTYYMKDALITVEYNAFEVLSRRGPRVNGDRKAGFSGTCYDLTMEGVEWSDSGIVCQRCKLDLKYIWG